MKDLLVTTHTPVLGSGRALRTYGVARALAAHGGLDLLYVRFEGDAPDAAFRAIPGIELHEVVPSRGARRLRAYGAARLAGVPEELARGISPELAAAAARLARAPDRSRVIADGADRRRRAGPLGAQAPRDLQRPQLRVEASATNSARAAQAGRPRTARLRAQAAGTRPRSRGW